MSVTTAEPRRVYKQKRLFLINLKHIYLVFKAQFSKLLLMATVVCNCGIINFVCEVHQNFKLMAGELPEQKSHRSLWICNMLHRFSHCSGQSAANSYLSFDAEDSTIYWQSVNGGHAKNVSMKSAFGELFGKFSKTADEQQAINTH